MMSSIWNSSNVGKKVHITVAWLPEPSYTFMLMRSASFTLATCSVKFGMKVGVAAHPLPGHSCHCCVNYCGEPKHS